MKGVKKCFLYLFTLMVVSLVSCLGICSHNTYAKKYKIESMPLYRYQYMDSSDSLAGNFGVDFYFQIVQRNMPQFVDGYLSYSHAPRWFGVTTTQYGTNCVWHGNGSNQNQQGLLSYNPDTGLISFPGFDIFSQANSASSNFLPSYCMQSSGFNSGSTRPMDWFSIPPLLQDTFRPLNPYFYSYASYFYNQSVDIDGVHYDSHGLNSVDILDSEDNPEGSRNNSRHISFPERINIPIGQLNDIASGTDFVNVVTNTSIQFSNEINIGDTSGYNNVYYPEYLEHAQVQLNFVGLKETSDHVPGGTYHGTISCPTTVTYYGLNDWSSPVYDSDLAYSASLSWNCDFVSQYDIYKNNISFQFIIKPGSDYDSIWNVSVAEDGDWSFAFYRHSMNAITDYDDTPGGIIGGISNGGDLESAPGSVYNQYSNSQAEANWFTSLTNLFGFSFINPFSPLFTMFTDSSTCANIPIIAGMLNSSNTQYCSWFSADTRNVLTPVLSISAMMLVFGFAVRWLSSSSGNMFEDQTTHKASNTQPKGGK